MPLLDQAHAERRCCVGRVNEDIRRFYGVLVHGILSTCVAFHKSVHPTACFCCSGSGNPRDTQHGFMQQKLLSELLSVESQIKTCMLVPHERRGPRADPQRENTGGEKHSGRTKTLSKPCPTAAQMTHSAFGGFSNTAPLALALCPPADLQLSGAAVSWLLDGAKHEPPRGPTQ